MAKYMPFLILMLILAGCAGTSDKDNGDSGTIPSGLLTKNDLIYLGAFRLPDGVSATESWEWGGTALTYYPEGDSGGAGDGFPGSLFGAGHAWEHRISEISIPVPVISPGKNVNELNTARTLQPFRDVLNSGQLEIPRTGVQYLSPPGEQGAGKLFFCVGQHNQEGERNPSHGMMNTSLADPDKRGLWQIGDLLNYVTNDYLFEIPRNWADNFISGKTLATGRFRDGGQGGMGPSLIAVELPDAGNIPPAGTALNAVPLLLYESVYLEDPRAMRNYHHSDEWSGGVWATAGDKAAVIFAGTKGTGACWYGFSNGVVWEEPYPAVPGYPHDDRGWWSTGFTATFLFYDPDDLRAVAEGEMESWEPQPYESADMGEYLFNGDFQYHETNHGIVQVQRKYRLGGCAFDRTNGLIYVFELFADGDKPVVHVWRVD